MGTTTSNFFLIFRTDSSDSCSCPSPWKGAPPDLVLSFDIQSCAQMQLSADFYKRYKSRDDCHLFDFDGLFQLLQTIEIGFSIQLNSKQARNRRRSSTARGLYQDVLSIFQPSPTASCLQVTSRPLKIVVHSGTATYQQWSDP